MQRPTAVSFVPALVHNEESLKRNVVPLALLGAGASVSLSNLLVAVLWAGGWAVFAVRVEKGVQVADSAFRGRVVFCLQLRFRTAPHPQSLESRATSPPMGRQCPNLPSPKCV